jgi:Xaa-Pro aminopeptidase
VEGHVTPADKLKALRDLMKAASLDAFVVPSEDAHSSEYVCKCDERRSFLSGFTGSAGTALVTTEAALLWTDARYFLQAAKQLSDEWRLMKSYEPGVPTIESWIRDNLPEGAKIGTDGHTFPMQRAALWRECWAGEKELVPGANLVDAIWPSRPAVPQNPIRVHPMELAGEDVQSKLGRFRSALRGAPSSASANYVVLVALDQIAWLFNLRGSDIMCNPVFFSYAVVSCDDLSSHLFIGRRRGGTIGDWLSAEVTSHLAAAGVTVHAYSSFEATLPTILTPPTGNEGSQVQVLVDKAACSLAIGAAVSASPGATLKETEVTLPVEKFKARKNASEIAGIRRASLKDSAAIVGLLAMLDERLTSFPSASAVFASEPLREASVCAELVALREKQEGYLGDSFETISASGPNSAVIHYKPEAGSDEERPLRAGEMYLLDTGGQYLDGTTDITRTLVFGRGPEGGGPTEEQRRCYTRVLQGHIALARFVFPVGTPGIVLDGIARGPLWADGLVYGHGTGHGIGANLNVHEGPIGIGGGTVGGDVVRRNARMQAVYLEPMDEGMYVSDEPGFYKDGCWGIRIESDLVALQAHGLFGSGPCGGSGNRPFLRFECVSKVPMCRALISEALLSPAEVAWLNEYHEDCRSSLSPLLADDPRALSYLERECKAFEMVA